MYKHAQPTWKIWKTIEVGTYQNAENLLQALQEANITINEWAEDIMKKPTFKLSPQKESVNLVLVKLSDLNLKPGAKLGEIYSAAQSLGLKLCSNEIGPVLRLSYKTQPSSRNIVIAMESIKDTGGLNLIFGLWKDARKLRLSYTIGDAKASLDPKDYIAFTI